MTVLPDLEPCAQCDHKRGEHTSTAGGSFNLHPIQYGRCRITGCDCGEYQPKPTSDQSESARPRLLDLFCGAGGAAMSYAMAGFEVTGVDIEPQPEYPFQFVQGDALDASVVGFDAVHASPPCQAYTRLSVMPNAKDNHPDLLAPTIAKLLATGLPFAVENVDGAPYPPDLYRFMLCGSHFGLRLRRHRWFVTNVAMLVARCQHDLEEDIVGVYGASDGLYGPGFKHPGIRRAPRQATNEEAREVMGMPWVTSRTGLTNAIPPAYAEFVGSYLMRAVEPELARVAFDDEKQ